MTTPDDADALHRSGLAAFQQGKVSEAVELLRRAVQLNYHRADYRCNLGLMLADSDPEAAMAAFRDAIELQPNLVEPHKNLATMLLAQGSLDEAIKEFSKALALGADVTHELAELAAAMRNLGRRDQAMLCYDRILAARPDNPQIAAARCYVLQLIPGYDAKKILLEHKAFDSRFAQPLKREIRPHDNDRNPNRALRIGYVSPDFKYHCQKLFTIPLLSHHDRRQFEIFCYASVQDPDEITDQIKTYADHWRDVVALSDEQVAQLIRQDHIDILVDLTMFMPHGRPLVFARKPAPVQIAWLAYPGTTGLEAMDYRLTDPYLDPPGQSDANYSEKSIRLPNTFWCIDWGNDTAEVQPLPAARNKYITFGCLNNFGKVNENILAVWGNILQRVPNSHLILMLDDPQRQLWVRQHLGIDPARVEFVPLQVHRDYIRTYNRIDIGLDTLPYNGHTTSLDSFWMGVPVITQIGKTVVGRAGWSQLNNLNLTGLAATTEADFIRIAVDLASDLPRLTEIRQTLRQRMLNSPLTNADRFTRDLETIYRQLWQNWVQGHAPA
jgi:protein O-GlcNAc transferase